MDIHDVSVLKFDNNTLEDEWERRWVVRELVSDTSDYAFRGFGSFFFGLSVPPIACMALDAASLPPPGYEKEVLIGIGVIGGLSWAFSAANFIASGLTSHDAVNVEIGNPPNWNFLHKSVKYVPEPS